MFNAWFSSRRSRKHCLHPPVLSIEMLENRYMLTMADIVFLVDESGSEQESSTHEWLGSIVSQLDATLRSSNGIDARYGLVGFADLYENGTPRFAYSKVVDFNPTPSKTVFQRLFSETDHIADLQTAISHLATSGDNEDGWDAIDHAIAEYDFRPGAVPIFVLVQNEEGRVVENQNATLTRNGILAALKSKNVILNALTVGQFGVNGPLFDLEPYGLNSDIRIVGVDADEADGVRDGVHNYYSIDTDTTNGVQAPTATTSDALQSASMARTPERAAWWPAG